MKHALELHKATDENPAKLDHATKEVLHMFYRHVDNIARPLSLQTLHLDRKTK